MLQHYLPIEQTGTRATARRLSLIALSVLLITSARSLDAGGFLPTVLNSAPHAGGIAIGCTFVEGPDLVYVLDFSGGPAYVYDKFLNHPAPGFGPTVPSPAGADQMAGIAWNPNNNHLYWLSVTSDAIYETLTN
jgi:hypothetical protein